MSGKIKENLVGKKFNHLTVLELVEFTKVRKDGKQVRRTHWKCRCDCEKEPIVFVITYALTNSLVKSCGHIQKEAAVANFKKATDKNRKYEPHIATAATIYREEYSNGNLEFKDFLILSQMNCHYCGAEPNNRKRSGGKGNAKTFKEESLFVYNGLDRIDPTIREHNKDNLVPCCQACNWAKSDYSYQEFYEWIKRVNKYLFDDNNIEAVRNLIK